MRSETAIRARLEEIMFALKDPVIAHTHQVPYLRGMVKILVWVLGDDE
jgi:hypothetical protein